MKLEFKINSILIFIFAILYVSNSDFLNFFYPDASTNYNVWLNYLKKRAQIYEIMFALVFVFLFLNKKCSPFSRAIGAFGIWTAIPSVIDKCFFNITDYRPIDNLLIIIGVLHGFYFYKKLTCKN